jgi:hypothetical protein
LLLRKRIEKLEAILPIAPRLLSDYIDRMAILSLTHEDWAWRDETAIGKRKPQGKTREPPGIKDRYSHALEILMKDLSDEELITLREAAKNKSK